MRSPRKLLIIAVVVAAAALLIFKPLAQEGAIPKPKPFSEAEGFRFRGGDAGRGKEAFAMLNCIQCHTVSGVEVPVPKGKRRINLTLASEKRFVKRYEDLVLAITNPRHVVTERYRAILTNAEVKGEIEPFMPDLTDHMSARQLMDLVAFLDGVYKGTLAGYGKPAAE